MDKFLESYFFVFFVIILLSILPWWCIYVVVCDIFFLFKVEQYVIICIYQILFIHSFIDGQLVYFHLLTIVNISEMNISVQIFLQDTFSILFLYIPNSRTSDSYGYCIFNFWGTTILFSIADSPFYIPTNNAQGFQFLHILTIIFYFLCFNNSHPYGYEAVSHYGIDFLFSNG